MDTNARLGGISNTFNTIEMANTTAFAEYLKKYVNINVIDRITSGLDLELADSQRAFTEINAMLSNMAQASEPVDNSLRHEDLSNFLEAGIPKLLLPDMTENSADLDMDEVIATMKVYAEDLKTNFLSSPSRPQTSRRELTSLDLEQYSSSLDQLCKRLANIKLSGNEVDKRNLELEAKLEQLCLDVNMFTQIVQAKATLSECNKNWPESQQSNALCYDHIINKLLSGINEVTYLLQNKN